MSREYRICNTCIMDTSDEEITFDDCGSCSHCQRFETIIKPQWHPPNEEGGEKELNSIVEGIKKRMQE